jgi:hypothetical protein
MPFLHRSGALVQVLEFLNFGWVTTQFLVRRACVNAGCALALGSLLLLDRPLVLQRQPRQRRLPLHL